ncbi:MAG: LptE family protein [Cyclobacteriaceae bacterium]
MRLMNSKYHLLAVICLAILPFLQGCGVYGFTGASISPDIKTMSIQTFFNNATLGPSNMSVLFTEKVKDYYQQNTSLVLVDEEGDLQLDGTIDSYRLTPVAPQGGRGDDQQNITSLTRLTISVKAEYINTQNDEYDFNKSFSFYVDFDQNTTDLAANEQQFLEEIFDQIILDIFNSSVANW